MGGVLSGMSHQSIAAGCYCILKVHSNYGNFKMLVELVLGVLDNDGDFEARSCPQSAFLVLWDWIPIYLSRDSRTGVHDGGISPLPFEMGGIGALT